MPVSTEHRPTPKRCKHCEEANHGGSVHWNIQLDQDLFNTIVSIYPEWFKGAMNKSNNGASNSGMAATDGCAATSISSASTSTSSTTAHSGGNTDGGISISDQQTQSQTAGSGSYCASSAPSAASSTTNGASSQLPYPRSPPKAEVDESPLQKSMDRNKQSLKVKLMLRRPITQLVAQGIMPQLKISPTIHEQRQKLERAKMGDLLKAKIQQRPDRQELVRQHILEADVGHVDPSLAERHRMLKKCRLVDSLNDQLSHRPGPLELIKKNILHTEEPIERAVKEGHIEFRATCEGQKVKLEPPDHYMTVDDDSQSSDAQSPRDSGSFISGADLSPPSSNGCAVSQSSASTANNSVAGAVSSDHNVYSELFSQTACDVLETAAKQAGIVTVVVPSANLVSSTAPSPISIGSSTSSLSPLSSVASPSSSINPNNTNNSNSASSNSSAFSCSSPALSASRTNSFSSHQSSSARDKNRKKSKSKSQQQKTRTIKFHEYKGPPSAHKNNNASLNSANSETSYDLLLKQQQLFLQWQLEWQQKYPQLKMPVSAKNMDHPMSPASPQIVGVPSPSPVGGTQQQIKQEQQSSTVPTMSSTPTPPPLPPPPPPPLPSNVGIKLLRNLEEMKVSDLKAELKKRNLPMSGPKPSLILRLKSFTENNRVNGMNSNTSNNISNNGKTILSDFNGNIVTVNKNNHSNSTNENSNVQSNLTIPYTEDSLPDSSVPSPMQHVSLGSVEHMDITRNSPQPPDTSVNKVTSSVESSSMKEITDEEIIKEQQKKIEELQRQLLNSQLLLQQQQRQQQHARSTKTFQPQQAISAKANLAAFLQQQQLNNLLIQQQKLQQQKQSFNQQANASNNVTSNSNTTTATSSNNNSNSNNNNNNNSNSNNSNSNNSNSNSNNSNSNNNNNNNNHNSNINGYSKQKISTANVQNKNEISTVKSNAQRQRSNTVILGQHPVTLMLNQVNLKSHNNQQRTNSLPNFVGTFVQPHLLLTDGSNIQQLVIDNDAIILPEQTKLDNFVNITSASSAPNNTNCNSNGTNSSGNNVPTISTLNSAAGGLNPVSDSRKIDQHLLLGSTVNGVQNGQQIVLENGEGGRIILENGTNRIILKDGSQFVFTNSGSNENPIGKLAVSANQRNNNFVTVGPFENNNSIVGSIEKTEPKTEPEYMASDDNNDISDLFKHDGERSIADVDDVLEMLMGSEEFLSMGTTTSNSEQPTMPDFVVSSAELSNGSSGISLTHSLASSSPVISSVVSSSSSSPLLSASPNNSSSSSSAGAVTTSSNNNSANVLNNGNNSGNNITTSLCNSIYGFRTGRSSDPTMDQNLPSQHVSLEALGLDVETFPPMDLVEEPTLTSATTGGLSSSSSSSLSSFMNNSESSNNRTEMMDVDTDWLDRLISSELDHSNLVANISSSSSSNYEPMMSGDTDPLDFFSIDDNDYKMAAEFCWDRVDFAT